MRKKRKRKEEEEEEEGWGTPGIDPQNVQPIASHCTNYAILAHLEIYAEILTCTPSHVSQKFAQIPMSPQVMLSQNFKYSILTSIHISPVK